MLRQILSRNSIQFGKCLVQNQINRKINQLSSTCVALSVSKTNQFLTLPRTQISSVTRPQSCSYCTEGDSQTKKKKQKKNAPAVEHVGRLDMRIGRVVEVEKAPDAETLYLTKIDIGGDIREIVAGLAKFIPQDQLLNQNVVVLCNIKPSKLRGHLSEGMIMCAKSGEILEPLIPPANSAPGDLVYCENFERIPVETPRDKKKLFDPLAADLSTNGELIACYQSSYLYVPDKGNIAAKSLKNASIM